MRIRIAIAIAAVVFAAAGGFAAGRLTAPEAGSAACDDAHAAFRSALDEATSLHDQALEYEAGESYGLEKDRLSREQATIATNVIVQNPDCFSASERATAQTLLDSAR